MYDRQCLRGAGRVVVDCARLLLTDNVTLVGSNVQFADFNPPRPKLSAVSETLIGSVGLFELSFGSPRCRPKEAGIKGESTATSPLETSSRTSRLTLS